MRMMLSSSFSNAFLGGLAVWAFLCVGGILVWAAVIAWGCFFHAGGDSNAVRITIIGTFLGILTAWTAGIFLTLNPAGISAPVLGRAGGRAPDLRDGFHRAPACRPARADGPCGPGEFLGAAATFAYLVQTPGRLDTKALFAFSFDNALIALPISMLIGAFLGYATAR